MRVNNFLVDPNKFFNFYLLKKPYVLSFIFMSKLKEKEGWFDNNPDWP